MGGLLAYPESQTSGQLSAGTIVDFVSGLTADPSDEPRPSLSNYFNERGIDAGLMYHDNSVKLYAEANAWEFNSVETPEDGLSGRMVEQSGYLNFGAMTDLEDSHGVYMEGRYSYTFGNADWTQPETSDFDGYHSYDGSVTTLSALVYADSLDNYHVAGILEHDNTFTVGGQDVQFEGLGAIGMDSDWGAFAQLGAEFETMLHGDTGTYAYARGNILIAENDGFSQQDFQSGIGTSILNNVTGGNLPIPPIEVGIQYDGEDVKPHVGIGFEF